MKKKCLFLGYNKNQTNLYDAIVGGGHWSCDHSDKILSKDSIKEYDIIISFGYRHIIKEEILNSTNIPIINLHIAYLPYNRGAHPNFWSFVENTPAGVTIHQVDRGIDTGKIIFNKIIDFNIIRNKNLSFFQTYQILINEIENLFKENIKQILNKDYEEHHQIGKGSYHNSKDLPSTLQSWHQKIYNTVLEHHNIGHF
jgi:methionyl-tRNA formyltransferase